MSRSKTIAICGAGIGGLAAASLLTDRGHTITLFERFPEARPIGSGLTIQPVGIEVLAEIGCADAIHNLANPLTRLLGKRARSGRRVLDVLYDHKGANRFHGLAIQRTSLFQTLLSAAARRGITPKLGHEVAARDGQRLRFADSTRSEAFDLIIDATGAGSRLSPLKTRTLPFGALWATVNWPDDTELEPQYLHQRYRRADRMIGVMHSGRLPASAQETATLFWSLPSNGHEDWQNAGLGAWRSEAKALWPEIAPFAAQITDAEQFTMARYSHGTLFTPISKGIAFIGDSAHRASPQLGQGANMALLDASALAKALDHPDLETALGTYTQLRRRHVAMYQAMSWAFTPLYQSRSSVLPWLRDNLLFPASLIPPVPALLSALVRGTL